MDRRKKLNIIIAIISFMCTISYYTEGNWLLGSAWCFNAFINVANFITD